MITNLPPIKIFVNRFLWLSRALCTLDGGLRPINRQKSAGELKLRLLPGAFSPICTALLGAKV